MGIPTLPLSDVIQVNVFAGVQTPATPAFNQMLIICAHAGVPYTDRVRSYTTLDAMLVDGFSTTSPAYLCAQFYFGQGNQPTKLWIGNRMAGETSVDALTACRAASSDWYLVYDATAADVDNVLLAAAVEAIVPQAVLVYVTSSADVLTNVAGNIFAVLKAAKYKRSIGIYATAQTGVAPKNIYAPAAIGGVAMGLNTGLPGSYYTLKFKQLVGILPEPLTPTQVGTIESINGNVYVNYANTYTWFEQGVMASGAFFDQILNRDMLCSDYQYTIIDALITTNAIGQDDAGQSTLLSLTDQCNARAVVRGYLAAGTWRGISNITVGNVIVKSGTPLPLGYLSLSAPYSLQSQSDHDARKAMPINIFVNETGAVHSLTIGVNINF